MSEKQSLNEVLLPNEMPGMMTSKEELLGFGMGITGGLANVVGKGPRPIETIEERHERVIREHEARISDLEEQIRRLVDHYKGHTHDERYMGHAEWFEL